MPKITSITPQRRRQSRVSIKIDGEFWTGMSAAGAEEMGFKVGMEVDEDERKRLESEIALHEAVDYCLRSLSARARSRHQLFEKLLERDYSEDVANLALDRCQDLGMLDDDQYARILAEHYRLQALGERKASMKLSEAGLDPELIEAALLEAYGERDPVVDALTALDRKSLKELDTAAQRRATQMLIRRGFDFGSARAAVEQRAMDEETEREVNGVEKALEVLQRKYANKPWDADQRRKAYAFMVRKGFKTDIIREAIEQIAV